MNELAEDEWESVQIGNHSVYITNHEGEPYIVVRDHAEFLVSGEHKGDVSIRYASGEFGCSFERLSEKQIFDLMYTDASPDT